jgi:hypothetical protein
VRSISYQYKRVGAEKKVTKSKVWIRVTRAPLWTMNSIRELRIEFILFRFVKFNHHLLHRITHSVRSVFEAEMNIAIAVVARISVTAPNPFAKPKNNLA